MCFSLPTKKFTGDHCFNEIVEPSNRAMVIVPEFLLSNLNMRLRSGFIDFTTLEETLSTIPMGLRFPERSPYYETFNNKIGRMVSNGVVRRWMRYMRNPKGIKRTKEEIGPQILTLDHLGVGFLACTIPLALGIIAFIFERGTLYSRTLRQKFVALNVLSSYLRDVQGSH